MNIQSEKKLINDIANIMSVRYRKDDLDHKWFLCFGSLLWFIRDRLLGIPFNTDLDLGVVYGEVFADDLQRNFEAFGWTLTKKIIDDKRGLPLQMVFKGPQIPMIPDQPNLSKINVDVFFWVRANGYWWHAYDYYGENPKNGIPREYIFKGTRQEALDGEPPKLTWHDTVSDIQVPANVGSCFDEWYPPLRDAEGKIVHNSHWSVPDKAYGWSKAVKTVKLKTCGNFGEQLK